MTSELRVFLSSTFKDFQTERDYLAKKVFPSLRQLCRERGIEFTEIDFRWGLTAHDSRKGRVVRACLQEIESSRPFFVGFLGERYGWVPPQEELDKDPDLKRELPWIEDAFKHGQSVTEIEFRHGFLNQSPGRSHPLVYFRNSTSGEPEDPRMLRLKREVNGHLGEVPAFTTPEELAVLVERDLRALIEEHWPVAKKESWLDEERAGHAAFAQSRRKAYVPDEELLAPLDEFLTSPEQVLIVTGASGGGKSSLLSYWANALRTRHPDHFIIEHYVGVTAASSGRETIMRRIVEEIRERINSDEPVPQSAEELEQSFGSWLARVSAEPMLIAVDAINQLSSDDQTNAQFLSWLPEHMPANIKWVVSATESEALRRLRRRSATKQWAEMVVGPITAPVRRRVLRAFLAGYRKKLTRTQENRIVNDPKSSSPLFLRTLLEELRLQGAHERLDAQITYYLASRDIADLFARILERIEQDYGTGDVRGLMRSLWAAPYGLSESEVIASTGMLRTTLSLLLQAFDFHFVRLKGRLSFFHDHLRQAIERRYVPSDGEKRVAYADLAQYFESADTSAMKAHSLPWLLVRAEEWPSLERALLDVALVPYLAEGSRSYDLLGYWLALEKHAKLAADQSAETERKQWTIDVVNEYEKALQAQRGILDAERERSLRFALTFFFNNAGLYAGAIRCARRALQLYAASDDDEARALTIDLSQELGKVYIDSGDLVHAEETMQRAMTLVAQTEGDASAAAANRRVQVRTQFAYLLKIQGKFGEAEEIIRKAFAEATARFGDEHPSTLRAMQYLAAILTPQGKYPEAERTYRNVLHKIEAASGPESIEVANALNELGHFLRVRGGAYEEAQSSFERAIPILEGRLGKNHPDVATLLNNLGTLHLQYDDLAKAEPIFLRAIEISEVAHGAENPKTADALNSYGAVLQRQRKYGLAEGYFRRALAIWQASLGPRHPTTAVGNHNLANLLRIEGKPEEAEPYCRLALEIRLEVVGPDHAMTGLSLTLYGRIKRLRGDQSAALEYLDRAYANRKISSGLDNPGSVALAVDLAEVLNELSLFDRAQCIIDEAIANFDLARLPADIRPRAEALLLPTPVEA